VLHWAKEAVERSSLPGVVIAADENEWIQQHKAWQVKSKRKNAGDMLSLAGGRTLDANAKTRRIKEVITRVFGTVSWVKGLDALEWSMLTLPRFWAGGENVDSATAKTSVVWTLDGIDGANILAFSSPFIPSMQKTV